MTAIVTGNSTNRYEWRETETFENMRMRIFGISVVNAYEKNDYIERKRKE